MGCVLLPALLPPLMAACGLLRMAVHFCVSAVSVLIFFYPVHLLLLPVDGLAAS